MVNSLFSSQRKCVSFFSISNFCCYLYHLYECNALSVKNVERNILCGGPRHETISFCCYLSQVINLDVKFQVDTIENYDDGASTKDVDFFFFRG